MVSTAGEGEPVPHAPFDVQRGTQRVTQPVLGVRNGVGPLAITGAVIGIIIGAVALLVVLTYLTAALGISGVLLASVLAIVPLVIVLITARWIDRWEPEPRTIWVFMSLWGAGVSVLVALLVDGGIRDVLALIDDGAGILFQAVIQAPIVEEAAKGFGILLVFLVARRHFDGPIDGIVYAAWAGAGFAFVENIQYFGVALAEGGMTDVAGTFLVRGLMSPFAHVMFTAIIGVAIGVAARGSSTGAGILAYLIGLVPAVLLHAFWNGALFVVGDFFGYYALVQVPLFALAAGIVLYLRGQERRITAARLSEYAAVGWFHGAEIPVLATGVGRRRARAWARLHGLAEQMRDYLDTATRLAFVRQRIVSGHASGRDLATEAELLEHLVAARRALQAPAFPR